MEKSFSIEKEEDIKNQIAKLYENYKGVGLFKAITSLIEENNCYYYYVYEVSVALLNQEKRKAKKREIIDTVVYALRFILLSRKKEILTTSHQTIDTSLFFQLK